MHPAFTDTIPLRYINRTHTQFTLPIHSPIPKPPCVPTAVIEPLNKFAIQADLRHPIAKGSFGEVFFGSLEDSGEPVVLKRSLSDPTSRTLFRTERAINRKIDNLSSAPGHWPKYLGEYCRNSQSFLVWKREGDGATLETYLEARPAAQLSTALGVSYASSRLNIPLFRKVVGELLHALYCLNSIGIVHGDIKPANILIAPSGKHPLKLIDFGSSCDVKKLFWSRGVDTIDPLYAAPEVRLSGVAPEKFDVFSVGLIGISVLMPSFASESRVREFRAQLEKHDFDLRRYRERFLLISSDVNELDPLFDTSDAQALEVFELLCAMLKKSPLSRKSVNGALQDLGMM